MTIHNQGRKIFLMVNQDRLIRNFIALGLIDGVHGNEADIAGELAPVFVRWDLTLQQMVRGRHSAGMPETSGRVCAVLPASPLFSSVPTWTRSSRQKI